MIELRTQVGIVGAGPAGLLLSHLLHLEGIESIVIETQTPPARGRTDPRRCSRTRHGGPAQLARASATACAAKASCITASNCASIAAGHRIDMHELTGGRAITVYGQHEVVKDLIAARLASRRTNPVRCRASVSIHDFDGDSPRIRFRHDGEPYEIACDFIGGCDGFHGVCRPSIPAGALCIATRKSTRLAGSASWPKPRPRPTS